MSDALDLFAAAALQGLLAAEANSERVNSPWEKVAEQAWKGAISMMRMRKSARQALQALSELNDHSVEDIDLKVGGNG